MHLCVLSLLERPSCKQQHTYVPPRLQWFSSLCQHPKSNPALLILLPALLRGSLGACPSDASTPLRACTITNEPREMEEIVHSLCHPPKQDTGQHTVGCEAAAASVQTPGSPPVPCPAALTPSTTLTHLTHLPSSQIYIRIYTHTHLSLQSLCCCCFFFSFPPLANVYHIFSWQIAALHCF